MGKSLEDIIYEYLRLLFEDNDSIARYGGCPAVFNTEVPADVDELWESENQYPRVVFELNMQADSERKISGRLFVDVMCLKELSAVSPEEMEAVVKSAVDGCFFSNQDMSISAQWDSSEAFSQKDNELTGITLTFDVVAYPVQETSSPDPILAVNEWLATLYQDAYVIRKDVQLPEVWKPTDKTPALYCRLTHLGDSTRLKSYSAVTWIGADMKVYVMAPSEQVRSTICKSIIQLLHSADKLVLDDGSPLLIDRVQENIGADPLKEGQIQIKATYGVLNEYTGTPITHISVKGMSAEREVY